MSTADEWTRYILLTVSFVCVLELIRFLVCYYRVIAPLKKRIASGEEKTLIAPPLWSTISYHTAFGLLLLDICVSQLVALHVNLPVIWPIYGMVVIIAVLTYYLNKFAREYTARLKEGIARGNHTTARHSRS